MRRKVSGKTKAVVQDRLKALHGDLETGVQARPNYTVRRAAEAWSMSVSVWAGRSIDQPYAVSAPPHDLEMAAALVLTAKAAPARGLSHAISNRTRVPNRSSCSLPMPAA